MYQSLEEEGIPSLSLSLKTKNQLKFI